MTISQALAEAKHFLRKNKLITTPELDAEILLAQTLHVSREHLFAHCEKDISAQQTQTFQDMLQKRFSGLPVDAIVGKKEFFGMQFIVNQHVLSPRPETEILVQTALKFLCQFPTSTILDIGTGSGCIAISLRKNLAIHHKIYATDISPKALQVAQDNATQLDAHEIEFVTSDLLENIILETNTPHPIVIVTNLPYIPETDILPPEVINADPHTALFAGTDGLDLYRQVFDQLKQGIFTSQKVQTPIDACFFEFHPPQKTDLQHLLSHLFPQYHLQFFTDLAGDIRFGALQKKTLNDSL